MLKLLVIHNLLTCLFLTIIFNNYYYILKKLEFIVENYVYNILITFLIILITPTKTIIKYKLSSIFPVVLFVVSTNLY